MLQEDARDHSNMGPIGSRVSKPPFTPHHYYAHCLVKVYRSLAEGCVKFVKLF